MSNSRSKNKDFLKPTLKIVIDTNVFISALFFGGLPAKLFGLMDKGFIQPVFSPETFKELVLFLSHSKFQKQRKKLSFSVSEFIKSLFTKSIFVFPKKIPQIIKEDSFDNYFLACAITSQASFIISGDKHLLRLKKFRGIPILSPQEFLKQVK